MKALVLVPLLVVAAAGGAIGWATATARARQQEQVHRQEMQQKLDKSEADTRLCLSVYDYQKGALDKCAADFKLGAQECQDAAQECKSNVAGVVTDSNKLIRQSQSLLRFLNACDRERNDLQQALSQQGCTRICPGGGP